MSKSPRVFVPGWDMDETTQKDPESIEKIARRQLGVLNYEGTSETSLDLIYERDRSASSEISGTTYRLSEGSSVYTDSAPETVTVDANIDANRVGLTFDPSETRIEFSDGQESKPVVTSITDQGALISTDIGGEPWIIRYLNRSQKARGQPYDDFERHNANWGPVCEQLENEAQLVHGIYREALDCLDESPKMENEYSFEYGPTMETELKELGAAEIFENKIDDKLEALSLGADTYKIFDALGQPWKPLLKMNIGDDRRTVLINSNQLLAASENGLAPPHIEANTLIGLSAQHKKDWNHNFKSESGQLRPAKHGKDEKQNGINYALNILNGNE